MKSRNVNPAPSMSVVVPFVRRASRPTISGWPGSYCCGAMYRSMTAELRIEGFAMSCPVRLLTYIFGYAK